MPRDHQVNKETGCTGVALEVSLLVEEPLGRFVIKSNAKNPRRYLQSQLGVHCFGRLQKGAASFWFSITPSQVPIKDRCPQRTNIIKVFIFPRNQIYGTI